MRQAKNWINQGEGHFIQFFFMFPKFLCFALRFQGCSSLSARTSINYTISLKVKKNSAQISCPSFWWTASREVAWSLTSTFPQTSHVTDLNAPSAPWSWKGRLTRAMEPIQIQNPSSSLIHFSLRLCEVSTPIWEKNTHVYEEKDPIHENFDIYTGIVSLS